MHRGRCHSEPRERMRTNTNQENNKITISIFFSMEWTLRTVENFFRALDSQTRSNHLARFAHRLHQRARKSPFPSALHNILFFSTLMSSFFLLIHVSFIYFYIFFRMVPHPVPHRSHLLQPMAPLPPLPLQLSMIRMRARQLRVLRSASQYHSRHYCSRKHKQRLPQTSTFNLDTHARALIYYKYIHVLIRTRVRWVL